MPPETRTTAMHSTYSSNLMDINQYYIPETIEYYLNWIDYSAYQAKFDFPSYKEKSKKVLEIE